MPIDLDVFMGSLSQEETEQLFVKCMSTLTGDKARALIVENLDPTELEELSVQLDEELNTGEKVEGTDEPNE